MTSEYLGKPMRSKPQAIRDTIARALHITYLIVCHSKDGPYAVETSLGTSLGAVVYDLATDQHKNPIGVLRIALDQRSEDVSGAVARDVLQWLRDRDHLYDIEGVLKHNDFLDAAWPDWVNQVPKGRKPERNYEPPEDDEEAA